MKTKEAILRELQDILGEKTDWGVYPQPHLPDDYFAKLPSRIITSIADEEVRDAEAVLPSSRALPYDLPENYFDELPGRMLDKIKAAEEKPAKVVSLKNIRRPWIYALAAAVTALIISTIILFSPHHQATLAEQLNKIPDQTIEAYLQNNTDAFDQETILQNLNINSKTVLSNVDNEFSPDAIKQYLEENGDLNNISLKN